MNLKYLMNACYSMFKFCIHESTFATLYLFIRSKREALKHQWKLFARKHFSIRTSLWTVLIEFRAQKGKQKDSLALLEFHQILSAISAMLTILTILALILNANPYFNYTPCNITVFFVPEHLHYPTYNTYTFNTFDTKVSCTKYNTVLTVLTMLYLQHIFLHPRLEF